MTREIKTRAPRAEHFTVQAKDPYMYSPQYSTLQGLTELWKWGSDNQFPYALARLNRRSNNHRGIIRSRIRYTAGSGFTCDEKNKSLSEFILKCNGQHGLAYEFKKYLTDKIYCGNNFIEIVTNARRSWVSIYSQDYTHVRKGKDNNFLLHPDWSRYSDQKKEVIELPEFPIFSKGEDGFFHSMIHMKQYEPGFRHYGLPDWIGGMMPGAIAYKTDKWNISRLDNSFNSSGIFIVDGVFESPKDEQLFIESVKTFFTGEGSQGKVLTITKDPGKGEGKGTQFIPVNEQTEGDWKELHSLTTDDLIIAHSWYRSLAGIADNTGFDTNRILNEYNIALTTSIIPAQTEFIEKLAPILDMFSIDPEGLKVINTPPIMGKPQYMKVWEARKADGMDYDENDPAQQKYLSEIGKGGVTVNG